MVSAIGTKKVRQISSGNKAQITVLGCWSATPGCIATDREWIQCSDQDCGMWSHVECLEESNGRFICALRQCVHVIIAYHVIAAPFYTVIIPIFVSDILILLQRKFKGDTSLRVSTKQGNGRQ